MIWRQLTSKPAKQLLCLEHSRIHDSVVMALASTLEVTLFQFQAVHLDCGKHPQYLWSTETKYSLFLWCLKLYRRLVKVFQFWLLPQTMSARPRHCRVQHCPSVQLSTYDPYEQDDLFFCLLLRIAKLSNELQIPLNLPTFVTQVNLQCNCQ